MATTHHTSARQLLTAFIQDHLGIEFKGFQSAYGHGDDLILFAGPHGSTLAVPMNTLHEPQETARRIVQEKVEASAAAFNSAIGHGRELATRGVELRGEREAA